MCIRPVLGAGFAPSQAGVLVKELAQDEADSRSGPRGDRQGKAGGRVEVTERWS